MASRVTHLVSSSRPVADVLRGDAWKPSDDDKGQSPSITAASAQLVVGSSELRQPVWMDWPWQRTPKTVLPSERGFLELSQRELDLPLREVLIHFRDLVSADMDWADSRKTRFRWRATCTKVVSLTLTGASTVVLGIEAIPARASIALPMVATVAALGAAETFFNWRSRWVLMEETQYRLNRLRDEMDYYLVATPSEEFDRARLEQFFADQQAIWSDVSQRWIAFRKLDRSETTEAPIEVRNIPQ